MALFTERSYTSISTYYALEWATISRSGVNVTVTIGLNVYGSSSSSLGSGDQRQRSVGLYDNTYGTYRGRHTIKGSGTSWSGGHVWGGNLGYTFSVGHYDAWSANFRLVIGMPGAEWTYGATNSYWWIGSSQVSGGSHGVGNSFTLSAGATWTSVGAPTVVTATPASYQLSGQAVYINWSGQTNGTGNSITSYNITQNGANVKTGLTTGNQAVTIPGTGTYDYRVVSVGQKNSATSSAYARVIGYTNVTGPTSVAGGVANIWMSAGAAFTLSWSGAANGANNAISYYTVNGSNVGNVTSRNYNAPAAGASATYTVKAVGVRNATQFGSASRTVYGVSINAVSALTVNPTTIINSVTLSWAHPTINSGYQSGLTRWYTLQYSVNGGTWTNIATGITATSYTWNPTTAQVPYGSNVAFRIYPYVYYSTTHIATGAATSTGNYLRGRLPNKIVGMEVSTETYIGDTKPSVFFDIENGTKTGSFNRLQSTITFKGTVGEKIEGYTRAIAGRWIRYGSTGTSGTIIAQANLAVMPVPGETDAQAGPVPEIEYTIPADSPVYQAADNDVIVFEFWGVNIIGGNQIPALTVDFRSNGTNENFDFRWNTQPRINLVENPIVSTNMRESINYNDKVAQNISVTRIKGIDDNVANFKDCGFRLYVRDVTTNPQSQFSIVDVNLFTTDGSFENNTFIPDDANLDSGQEIILDVLDNSLNTYLYTLLGDLTHVNRLVDLEYRITAVDNYWREGTEFFYDFSVKYDFRVQPKMESEPILFERNLYPSDKSFRVSNGNFNCIPLTNTYNGEIGDAIVFEWYPAYDANNQDQYISPTDHTIDFAQGVDPIDSYRLYRYTYKDGAFIYKTDTVLTFGVDYFKMEDEDGRLFYRGRYNIQLTNSNIDEIIYLAVAPVAVNTLTDSITNTKLNHNFYCSRLSQPIVNVNSIERVLSNTTMADILFEMPDNGGSKQIENISIDDDNWDDYNNLLNLQLIRIATNIEPDKVVDFSPPRIPFVYERDSNVEEIDFGEVSEQYLANKVGYIVRLTVRITYRRIRANVTNGVLTIQVSENNYIDSAYSEKYVPPTFGTLSLRKNKIGINRSDLAENEEALTITGKDRVDGDKEYYKNILAIEDSTVSEMPLFDGETPEDEITTRARGSYVGFYHNEVDETQWKGSIGFDTDGFGYIVERDEDSNEKIKRRLYQPSSRSTPLRIERAKFGITTAQPMTYAVYTPVKYDKTWNSTSNEIVWNSDGSFTIPDWADKAIIEAEVRLSNGTASQMSLSFSTSAGSNAGGMITSDYTALGGNNRIHMLWDSQTYSRTLFLNVRQTAASTGVTAAIDSHATYIDIMCIQEGVGEVHMESETYPIGNGRDYDFVFTHNKNTLNLDVSIETVNFPRQQGVAGWEKLDNNSFAVHFKRVDGNNRVIPPPAAGKYQINVNYRDRDMTERPYGLWSAKYNAVGGTNSFANGTHTNANYPTLEYAQGISDLVTPSASDTVFTVNYSGFYLIHASLVLAAHATGDRQLSIITSKKVVEYDIKKSPSLTTTLGNIGLIYLDKGDTIRIQIYQNSGAVITCSYPAQSALSIVKLDSIVNVRECPPEYEYFENENGKVFKYFDGRLECYIKKTYTNLACTTAANGGGYFSQLPAIVLPHPFTEITSILCDCDDNCMFTARSVSLTQITSPFITSIASWTFSSTTVYAQIKGRWK